MGKTSDFVGCTAADKALALPEIRCLISHYITERRDVLACILVSSAWRQTFSAAPLWNITTLYCSNSVKRNPPTHRFLEHSVHVRHLVISDFFAITNDLILLLEAYTTARASDSSVDKGNGNSQGLYIGISNSHTAHRLVSLSINHQLPSDFQYNLGPGAGIPRFQQLLATLVRCNSATLERIQLHQLVTAATLGQKFWLAVAALPNLKQLHLSQCGIKEECVHAFMLSCNRPLELLLSGITEICPNLAARLPEDSHQVQQDLARLPSNVRRIKVVDFKSLTPELQLRRIIARHRELQQLDWRLSKKADSKDYAETVRRFLVWEQGLPKLEGLNFPYSDWSDDDLVTIIQSLSQPPATATTSFGHFLSKEGSRSSVLHMDETSESAVCLTACRRNITSFGVRGSGFGLKALAALGPHFSSLTNLDLRECPAATSPMLQLVLETADNLQRFRGDLISRHDILHGYDWVCAGLTHWKCYIDMGPTPDHDDIFERLAVLKSLRILDLSQRCQERQFRHGCTLDLRLHMGLGHLAELKCMQVLKFEGTMQAMGDDETNWMMRHWPHLRKLAGKHYSEP
ncbi:hypothetical protein BGZ68_006994 [Mortierella alpina]|nr:hypothetical protein BGZ68_006994 [Mortierella alpina]